MGVRVEIFAALAVLVLLVAVARIFVRGLARGTFALVGVALLLVGVYACGPGLLDFGGSAGTVELSVSPQPDGWQMTVAGTAEGPFRLEINGEKVGRLKEAGTALVEPAPVADDAYRPDPRYEFRASSTSENASDSTRRCAPVVLLAVRGTNENPPEEKFGHGVGSRGWRTWEYVQGALGLPTAQRNALVSAHPVRYPAAAVDTRGIYSGSRNEGTDALRSLWSKVDERCPDSQIVMLGYSQGADVVASAWQDPREPKRPSYSKATIPRSQVRAVVLYADPHFNKRWRQQGITRPRDSEFLRDGAFGARRLFSDDEVGVVQAWCMLRDPVCQRDSLTHPWHGDEYNCYEQWAAADIARAVAPGLRDQGYSVADPADPGCTIDPGTYRPGLLDRIRGG